MKRTILLIISVFTLSLVNQAKDTPLYTLIKNAEKIVVVQDFMLPNIDQASNISQTFNTTLSEKLPITTEYRDLNNFICDNLNKKYKVSSFEVGADAKYYKNKTIAGQETKVFDNTKIDADLIIRVLYKECYIK